MFSLYFKQDDTVTIEGVVYSVNASFDNILKLIDMLRERRLTDSYKLRLGVQMLFGENTNLLQLPLEQLSEVFQKVFEQYVVQQEATTAYDREGNAMPQYDKDTENYYSLLHDAEYIYASFMQTYHIDLLDMQGKLHWFKFQALLSGLPEGTKFREVVSIRQWKKPSKSDTEAKRMAELKEIYKLPGEEEI